MLVAFRASLETWRRFRERLFFRVSNGLREFEEGVDAVRYVLWDATGWHRDYSPHAWRHRATEEQKKIGWEMVVRIEKILCTVRHEAHERQIEETMQTLGERPEGFYKMSC